MIRRLLLLTLALLAGLSSVQAVPVGYVGHVGRMGPSAQYIDPDAKSAFAVMTVQPSFERQRLYSTTILSLKQSGVWPKLDMLQIYAAHDSQAARVDLKNPNRIATAVNSPSFLADRYFAGDGSTSYVDTGYNPASGPNYAQNSASLGMWSLTAGAMSASSFGWFASNGSFINPRNTGDTHSSTANGTAVTAANASGAGLFAADRSNASNVTLYRNGISQGSSANSSTAVVSSNFNVDHSTSSSYSTRQVAAVFAGRSLTAADHLALYNALSVYLMGVGAQ